MARSRRNRQDVGQRNTTQTQSERSNTMATIDITSIDFGDELTLDEINAVSAGGSEKGKYKRDLVDFIESNKMGQRYQFDGVKAQSVKTGFESAVDAILKDEKATDEQKDAARNVSVKVRKSGEGDAAVEAVFLLREDLIREAKAAAA